MPDPARDAMAALCVNSDHKEVGEHVRDASCGFGSDRAYFYSMSEKVVELYNKCRALEAELAAARLELDVHAYPPDLEAMKARAEALSRKLAEATKALRAAKEAMDRYDPRDCPHSSPKGYWDTHAQGLVDAFLSSDPAGRGHGPWCVNLPRPCDHFKRRSSAESDRAECEE